MPATHPSNPEWLIRKQGIDPSLDALGWRKLRPGQPDSQPHRIEEYETASGPADYALCRDGRVLGVVEAKKLTVDPQNVLTQAERYARGARDNPFNFAGFRVPFLYSTNGEVIWFRDARHAMNRSRPVAGFHTPAALAELMDRDFDAALAALRATPNAHPRMRPYQIEANPAHIQAIEILLQRPRDWSTIALKELREKLSKSPQCFTPDLLQKAHAIAHGKALVDIISMVKHAAEEKQPLLTAEERVERAFDKLTAGKTFTPQQQKWLDRIREHLVVNLTIEQTDFDFLPVFADFGGWGKANKDFDGHLMPLITEINTAVAA